MYQKTVLDNSVRIVTERIEKARTVSVGIWVDVGSRDEHDLNNGCAHFVEHMLFKGTKSRSAQQISRELDMLGGMSNAFTSNETTCFYATVLDDQVDRLADLFCDLFLNSVFDPKEVERERQVILQEISMVEDTPDDQVHELFASLLWKNHPLGHTVLGPREVVAAMDSHHLEEYVNQYYTQDKILIAAAGNIDHQNFCKIFGEKIAALNRQKRDVHPRLKPLEQKPLQKVFNKPLEQVHMLLGTYGLSSIAEERYALFILNVLLGGNMSSRLFQEIREKRGLAYSIYSYLASYTDSGYVGIYLGIDRESVNEALELINKQIYSLRHDALNSNELADAKDYAKAGFFLASENMEARMTRLARNELVFGRYISIDEVAEGIDQVAEDDIKRLADTLFGKQPLTCAAIGPLQASDFEGKLYS